MRRVNPVVLEKAQKSRLEKTNRRQWKYCKKKKANGEKNKLGQWEKNRRQWKRKTKASCFASDPVIPTFF